MHCRWMVQLDLPDLCAIEAQTGGTWGEAEFRQALRARNCIGMVAENGRGEVVGYFIYELERERLTLLRFAVRPDRQRSRVGRALMTKFAFKIVSHRKEYGAADVPETNLPALLFLRACGWRAVKLSADAVRMVYAPSDADYADLGYTRPVNRVAAWMR